MTTVTLGSRRDVERHGGPVRRLLRDRHDHIHAVPGQHRGRHGDGRGQRQRHVHDADRLHAADDRYGDGHLPVGRELQRRRNNNSVSENNVAAEQVTVEPGQPCDHDDAER